MNKSEKADEAEDAATKQHIEIPCQLPSATTVYSSGRSPGLWSAASAAIVELFALKKLTNYRCGGSVGLSNRRIDQRRTGFPIILVTQNFS